MKSCSELLFLLPTKSHLRRSQSKEVKVEAPKRVERIPSKATLWGEVKAAQWWVHHHHRHALLRKVLLPRFWLPMESGGSLFSTAAVDWRRRRRHSRSPIRFPTSRRRRRRRRRRRSRHGFYLGQERKTLQRFFFRGIFSGGGRMRVGCRIFHRKFPRLPGDDPLPQHRQRIHIFIRK